MSGVWIHGSTSIESDVSGLSPGEAAHRYLESVEANRNGESGGEPVFTGFANLDRFTLGLGRGDLIIFSDKPSNVKTTLTENIASENVTIAFFSQEMLGRQIAENAVSATAKVDSMRLRVGCASDTDRKRAVESLPIINEAPIYICDLPKLSSAEMKARVRRLKREHGLDAIFVDYLQLMAGASISRSVPSSAVIPAI